MNLDLQTSDAECYILFIPNSTTPCHLNVDVDLVFVLNFNTAIEDLISLWMIEKMVKYERGKTVVFFLENIPSLANLTLQ